MEKITLASISKALPTVLHNPETQVMIFGILCFIGAWVVITKIIQIIFSFLWPVVILIALLVLLPNVSNEWYSFWLNSQVTTVFEWLRKQYEDYIEGKYSDVDFKKSVY